MRFFGTTEIRNGMIHIGGVSVKELAENYKTPLYIYDMDHIETNIKKYKEGFKSDKFKTEIVYASKAFLAKSICQIIDKYGLAIDAVSGGELYTIKESGFPHERIHMHGNNKTPDELEMAFEMKIGSIIADNIGEISNLGKISKLKNQKMKVALRINLGIDAHTHEYIKTANHSSKFGESVFDTSVEQAVAEILKHNNLQFIGFHSHIGSQIFDTEAFLEAIDSMVKYTKKISDKFGIFIPEMNLGGGFGVYYVEGDVEIDINKFMKEMILKLESSLESENLKIDKVSIEPGRSIVANAGTTLYTVGGQKTTFSGANYVFIDGGMTDNMRPALYQAEYEAIVANKANDIPTETVNIAGKCCESGDIILKNVLLQKAEENDLILVGTTGAYGYSMSNNYNKLVRPGVVFVKNGKSYLSIKREEYSDLTKDDLALELE